MSYLKERVAYLRGLAEGMQLNEATNEGKLLKAIIEVLDDVAIAVEDVEEIQDQLGEQVDTIDEDLAELERIVLDEDEEEEDEDEAFTEITCPHCNEDIVINTDMIDLENNTIDCPNCNKKIDVEWECDCDECGDQEK